MDNITLQKVQDLIAGHEAIGVVVGANPTVDQMAAALSIYLYLTTLNKKVSVASATQPLVEISSLVGIDKVKTSLDGNGGDLIVSFPYKDNEIQKVSYTIEEGYLNIVVKAGDAGLTFSEQDIKYTRGGGIPTLLFVIGTPRLSDLGQLFDAEKLKDTLIINIDNKADNQGFGDVVLVSSNYSSVSEQVAQFLSYIEPNIDADVAQNLLSGISDATANFQSPNASYLAFEMAGFLLRRGASRVTPGRTTRSEWSEEALRPFNPINTPAPVQSQPNQQRQQNPTRHGSASSQQGSQGEQSRQGQGQNQGRPQQQRGQQAPQSQGGQKKEETKKPEEDDKNPAPDWLMPKVYRGTSNV